MGTSHGGKLAGITTGQLRGRLAERPADGRAVARLVAAREYKAGLSPAQIEAKYGWPEGTVYHWLDYLEKRGLDDGLDDQNRTGRPSKLTGDQWSKLHTALMRPPAAAGYDRRSWGPSLVRSFIQDEFDVEYSLRHVRRLMQAVEET